MGRRALYVSSMNTYYSELCSKGHTQAGSLSEDNPLAFATGQAGFRPGGSGW